MDLPELAEDGCNWQTYSSWVLKAISEDGLIGHLDGSETRPTTPKLLQEYGARWTPRTNEERDVITAWKTADDAWHQRAAMAHQFIIYGLPDSILMLCMHLDTPRKAFAYLEYCYGQIPRPEIQKTVDEAVQQHDMPSEQYMTGESAQSTCNSDNEPGNLPGGHEDPVDSLNDCAETKSGFLTPKTKVTDVRHVEPHLLVVEVRAMDSKWLDEGTDAAKAPDEGSQRVGDKVKEDEDLPQMSSEALETRGDLPFTTCEHAETQTGHRKPKNEVVDTWQVVDVLPMFEVGSTGQAWYDKHVKELEASDKGALLDKPVGAPLSTYHKCLSKRISEMIANYRSNTSPRSIAELGMHFSMTVESKTRLEIKAISANMVETRGSLPHAEMHLKELDKGEISSGYNYAISRDSVNLHSIAQALPNLPHMGTCPKEPDKAGDTSGGGDDAASKEFVDSHGVEKTLLANSRRTIRDPHRRGRMKTRAENISNTRTRQNAYITHAALKWPPPLLFASSKRFMDPMGGLWMMNIGYNEIRRARQIEMRGHMYWIARMPMWLVQPLFTPMKCLRYLAAGSWMLPQLPTNSSKRLWNVINTYWWKGVSPEPKRNDTKRPRNLHMAKWLPCSSGRRQDDTHTSIYSPAPSKPARNNLAHPPGTLRDPCRRGRIKTKPKNMRNVETRLLFDTAAWQQRYKSLKSGQLSG
ncbi:hypothetical protein F5141DRAFT_1066945 [Pisolithus sp. B1]|nr:hypothetical protein F5141DRAFT_1066945 [Pisolithus sp. B1]